MNRPSTPRKARPPVRLSGIVFAFAANLLLCTAADALANRLPFGANMEILATMVAPLLSGVLTALYVRERGGMHAFLGGMLSVPVLAVFVFPHNWQFAVFAGAFCTIGGGLSEILMRRRVG